MRPVLGLALGAGALPLFYYGVFPALLPALLAQAGPYGIATGETLLALLPFLAWAGLARLHGERPLIIGGGLLLTLALIGFLILLRQPLGPDDSLILPSVLWIAVIAGAAGLVVGNHLHLIRLGGGSGGRITVMAAAAATLFGPILVAVITQLLQSPGTFAIPLGPILFWAAMALALAFVTWRSPAAAAPAATTRAAPAAAAAAAIGLVLLLAPIVWLNAIRQPLLEHAALVGEGQDLAGQAALIGFAAIGLVLMLVALHPGLGLLVAGPLAAAVVLWALYGLDIQVPVSLAWGVSSNPAYALAVLAGFAAILGRGAGPLRVGVAWTALQVAAVLGNRAGPVWWQYNQFVVTDGMQWTGIAMAVLGALALAGVILARRAP
ncbi:hypothetical protein [Inquilinus sp. CA228]|uniref:hypothetical protein n=1 Tax=Inquilinus sp. CA228 TaxID=3455609 RepID=UPI003F8D1930